jgi:chemotaxis protein methyltransferase CheR/type IV pilus assembly protein PilK
VVTVPRNAAISETEKDSVGLWKEAIELRTGVKITPDREKALSTLLHRRMKELECADINQYFENSLDDAKGAQEWSGIIDSLLIKETSFFRHQPSMDFVTDWVAEKVSEGELTEPLWVWSLGCSTGEEAYSLAILIEKAMNAAGVVPRYGIIGTDISRDCIAQARRGVYRQSKMTHVNESLQETYFDQVGKGLWRVKDSVRRRVCFVNSNVLTDQSPMARRKMHLIYCQNMLIYFRRWKRREIVNQLIEHLETDGRLILGLGELGNWIPPGLSRVAPRTVQAYVKSRYGQQGDAG